MRRRRQGSNKEGEASKVGEGDRKEKVRKFMHTVFSKCKQSRQEEVWLTG